MNLRPTVAYSCNYVPPEWIAAHGCIPIRILPSIQKAQNQQSAKPGICPYCQSYFHEVFQQNYTAAIVSTICDPMRRLEDWLKRDEKMKTFILNVPTVWGSGRGQDAYCDELRRLGQFLETIGGRQPDGHQIVETCLQYECHLKAEMLGSGDDNVRAFTGRPIRLALVGSPLCQEQFAIFDWIEHSGAQVVLNATENGELGIPRKFQRGRLYDDAAGEIADAYWGTIPAVFRRPNTMLYDWLARKFAERRVQAIIMMRNVWCDLWHAEEQTIRERFGLPMVVIQSDDSSEPRVLNRIQALLETAA